MIAEHLPPEMPSNAIQASNGFVLRHVHAIALTDHDAVAPEPLVEALLKGFFERAKPRSVEWSFD
jgi:hypothetical protein